MRFKTKYSKKIFPFAPGIPWTIKNNKFIVPEIDGKVWTRILSDKDFIIFCYGGFLESFFSLSYCEALKKIHPTNTINWIGYDDFHYLVKSQGLASVNNYYLPPEILEKYPTPIFMDSENNIYFNVLNNYINSVSFIPPNISEKNNELILKQIYQNCLLEWDSYNPQLRFLQSKKYDDWKKQSKFYDNSKFIVIFPEFFNMVHSVDCLQWNSRQIREFAIIVKQLGISVVVCGNSALDIVQTNNPIIKAPLDIEVMINLISRAWGVLSANIDQLFISMVISKKAIIMSRDVSGNYDLYANADFIQSENVIFSDANLNPVDLFKFCEGNV